MPPKQHPDAPERSKHFRPAVSDIALALAQRPRSEPVSTVALTLNARGDVQIQVDVDDPDIAAASKAAQAEFDRLCKLYPRKENGA